MKKTILGLMGGMLLLCACKVNLSVTDTHDIEISHYEERSKNVELLNEVIRYDVQYLSLIHISEPTRPY